MSFLWCTIRVKDLAASLNFYQDIVGLTIEQQFQAGPHQTIVFLGNGETKVELIENKDNLNPQFTEDISLGFKVDSLDALTDLLKEKGIKIHSGPFSPQPTIKFLYVVDPNGVKIQFVETK